MTSAGRRLSVFAKAARLPSPVNEVPGMYSRKRTSHVQRARALALVAFGAIAFGSVLVNPAHAYVGQELLQWVGDNIIFPLGLLALVCSLESGPPSSAP